MDDLTYVKNISSWDSGGGLMVDLIELRDGRVLGITDEVVILYGGMEDVISGDANARRPSIML
jgi:hypothetical protein